MDQNRQIRFLVPPLIFILSIIWGAYLSNDNFCKYFYSNISERIIGLLAAGAVAVITLGYIISSISIIILRFGFCVFNKFHYETVHSDDTLKRIWCMIKTESAFDGSKILYAVSTFDHEILSRGVHEWLTRRWSSFNISVHSCVALILSHILAPFFNISQSWAWFILTVILLLVFICNAIIAWRETMNMIDFQSHRNQSNNNNREAVNNN